MHIKELDVFRFAEELSHVNWFYSSVVLLDEVSFDNRGMIRKRCLGAGIYGVTGIIDYYNTEGTFDRVQFFTCCRDFAYSARGHVRQYPGSNSVWIMDGASIHRGLEIIHFLRSIGIVPNFSAGLLPILQPN
ncbi:uncharacterized protein PITG_11053 [Phytophthora infestans T30-4]|uniref:Tc1-like transposase DDE domain-containing protein n=1 Tax=Phytophthora infestans (strain T30-4) TaxID=403677 RepID=D0NG26_PHYIT|nr:uncharacterized protein PITG_11053 [Phytophthora infestans T30-4]EEY57227.1 conserved hypothetical protein [Phytophthora infestans T30-4]|eukprot:XP_002901837.1 conserved hypothetical protein [Phytophthora infestans T30-4]